MSGDCGHCPRRKECKAICPEVEKMLRKREVGGSSIAHKKRKEVLFPTDKLERVAAVRAFQLRFGNKYDTSEE